MMKVAPTRVTENNYWSQGYELVAGVDEVGRGALAGPVVAAAVVLPRECRLEGVRDSKQLTGPKRQEAARNIKAQALAVGLGWVSHAEVDEHGLSWSVRQSGLRALSDLGIKAKAVVLDGNHNYLEADYHSQAIIKADQTELCVAAASVIAKVARDNYMELVGMLHPSYGFESNKGYGSAAHKLALAAGISPIHRLSYAPVAGALRVD